MAPPQMSLVLFVEALHPVDFVNITHVKSQDIRNTIKAKQSA